MRARALDSDARYRLVTDDEQLDGLEPAWRQLWQTTSRQPPMLEWDWAREWWRTHGADGTLMVVVAEDASGRPIGIAPLYLRRREGSLAGLLRTIYLLGMGEAEDREIYSSHGCWLAADSDVDQTSRAVTAALRDHRGWDRLVLRNLLAGTGIESAVRDGLGTSLSMLREVASTSYQAAIRPIGEYIDTKEPGTHRRELRRVWRVGQRAGTELVRARDVATALEMFERLCEMHQRQWTARDKAGACGHPAFRAFHETIIRTYQPSERLWMLGLRDGQGQWLAYHYLVLAGGTLYGYLAALDPEAGRALSAGKLTLLHIIEEASAAGIATLDFFGGSDEYKGRIASGTIPLLTFEAMADRPATRAWNGLRRVRNRIAR